MHQQRWYGSFWLKGEIGGGAPDLPAAYFSWASRSPATAISREPR